ncbi:MAG: hypothetical protein HY690_01655 [Chloroflexi bacterium]|nr:hypothetical protein [Chloroflexota bacterium]
MHRSFDWFRTPRTPLIALSALVLLGASCAGPSPNLPPSPNAPSASSAPEAPALPPSVEQGRFTSPTPAVHVLLWGQPGEVIERTLVQARQAGFRWVKQRFEWRYVEPHQKGGYEWNEPDRLVNALRSAGLGIIARVDDQPVWTNAQRIFPVAAPPDRLDDWGDFLSALAGRYKGKIQAYEVWNEPNIAREWGEQRPDPARYAEMLKVSYQAIKRADPQALVITAGLSPTTERSERAMPPADYLEAMYRAGAKGSFDLLGVHAAGFKASPEADPADVAANPQLANNDPSELALRRVYAFRYVEDLRALMERNGDGQKQVAVLEMGWTTDLRPNSPYHWHAVSLEQQGDYLVGALGWAEQRWASWIGPMTIIYLAQPDWTARDEQYWWSITNPDGTTRPAYEALKRHLGLRGG